jgi:hypothetical protein
MKRSSSPVSSVALHLSWLSCLALSVGALGCGSQVSPEYFGEALLSLRGSVVVDNPDAPSDLVPVLAFDLAPPGHAPISLLADVAHRGEFPARFQLAVFDPPPARAMYELRTATGRELTYAWAQIAAVAPDHPSVIAQTNPLETSYCIGRECYTDITHCDEVDECYYERQHCTLPARFDEQYGESDCRQVGTIGDIGAILPSPEGWGQFDDGSCDEDSCQHVYTWCAPGLDCAPPEVDGCRPPADECYARVVECAYDPDAPVPASSSEELDYAHWRDRDDLSGCEVTRQGNLDYAASPGDWLAGFSYDVFVSYVPDGFDPIAFEEAIGVPAPDRSGYSLFVLDEYDAEVEARFNACWQGKGAEVIAAYNLEHGTDYTIEGGIPQGAPFSGQLLDIYVRCNLTTRGHWYPDPLSADLLLHVDVPAGLQF